MIKNRGELETSAKRKQILNLIETVIKSVHPSTLFEKIKLKNNVLILTIKLMKLEEEFL